MTIFCTPIKLWSNSILYKLFCTPIKLWSNSIIYKLFFVKSLTSEHLLDIKETVLSFQSTL